MMISFIVIVVVVVYGVTRVVDNQSVLFRR